jgi:hypothetical protein
MLDDGDKAIIEQIAYRAAEHTAKKVEQSIKLRMELHQAECPVGRRLAATENAAKGGWKVLATIGAAVMSVAALVVSWLKG